MTNDHIGGCRSVPPYVPQNRSFPTPLRWGSGTLSDLDGRKNICTFLCTVAPRVGRTRTRRAKRYCITEAHPLSIRTFCPTSGDEVGLTRARVILIHSAQIRPIECKQSASPSKGVCPIREKVPSELRFPRGAL